MKAPKIKATRAWFAEEVREFCIKNGYYTAGDCAAYEKMLQFVSKQDPTTKNIYRVAKDIVDHSDPEYFEFVSDVEALQNVMFLLDRDVVMTFYNIEE